jgi:cytochrome c biogenesis protein
MALKLRSLARKTWQTAASIKTGVVLLILVVILSAAGTIVLQRPVTENDEMQRAYSPQALRFLDGMGLTDVFHAWWFVVLMVLVSVSIIAASIERFPNSWRFYSRPYKYPDETFRRALYPQRQLAIPDEETGLVAAERALHSVGFSPERVVRTDHFSIFAERNRLSEMAVYIVHASLLLIFAGGIVDGLYGWRGTLNLNEGETSNQVELRDGAIKTLPFAIRCDTAGQENYKDGSPKQWWSKLAVVASGQDVKKKEIVVNDPLVYQGIRFYQSTFGSSGKVEKLALAATPLLGDEKREIAFRLNETASLDADTTVRFAEFIPDFVVREGEVYKRSNQLANPAARLVVTTKAGSSYNVWLPALDGIGDNARAPYQFEATELKMGHFTGLQVSHEPGQWAVWGGVILLGIGLAFVFYIVHMRFWAVPVLDAKTGKYSLWIGGTANRNRDAFGQQFNDLVGAVEEELKSIQSVHKPAPQELAATGAGR